MAIKLADAIVYFGGDDSQLEASLSGAEKKTGSFVGGATKLLGGALVGGAVLAAGAIAGIGKAAFDVSLDTEKATANIAAQLGITTEAAEGFGEVARQVFGNNFADSVAEAGDAVAVVSQQLGLAADDPALKDMTENAFRLRDAFGVDVTEGISGVKTLMENFGLTGTEAFDLIASGFQRGLDRSGDFLDTIGEYSTQFAAGGADAGQFFSLLDSGLQGGMLGTDKAADAFKEFRLRLLEGSDDAMEALDMLEGTIDSGIVRGLKDGSISAADAFEKVVQGVASTQDPMERMAIGTALLGTQFEDLGDQMFGNLTLTNDWAAGTEGAIGSVDAKYANFGDAMTGLWRRLIVSIAPFTDKLLDLVNSAMPSVMAAFDTFDRVVVPAMTNIGNVISNVIGTVSGLFQGQLGDGVGQGVAAFDMIRQRVDEIMPYIQQIVGTVLQAITSFWDQYGAQIMAIVQNVFGMMQTVIGTTLDVVLQAVKLFLQVLTGDWEGAGQTLRNIVETLWNGIKEIFRLQLDNLRVLFGGIDWSGLGRSIIEGIANGIRDSARRIADAAKDAARDAFNAAKSYLGIGSPSKLTAEGIGEPFAEGIAEGAQRGMRRVGVDINAGLQGLMGGLSIPGGGGGAVSVTVYQSFGGDVDVGGVRRASNDGVLAGLRRAGLR